MTAAVLTPPAIHRRSGFGPLLACELRLFVRSAGAVLWSALLPLVALIVLGNVPALTKPAKTLHGISYLDAYLPILMMFSLCMATVNLLPPTLATYRERGILRRLGTTPVPPRSMLAAQATIYLGTGVVVSVAMLTISVTCFDVHLPPQLAGFVVTLLLVALATTGAGLLIAGLAPSGKAANAISMASFFPLMFLAGLWLPRAQMPTAVRDISDYSPLGAGVRGIQASIEGHWPPAGALLVLTGYTIVLMTFAVRTFRWE